jgi:hypothetical protein
MINAMTLVTPFDGIINNALPGEVGTFGNASSSLFQTETATYYNHS